MALTMGDPAGIGFEIALKCWQLRRERALPPFILFADPDAVRQRASAIGQNVPIEVVAHAHEAMPVFARALPIFTVPLAGPSTPGQPDARNALATIVSIEAATSAVVHGQASALVTNPIAKNVLYAAGFAHPGHTEFLGHLSAQHYPGQSCAPVMMLACDELRVVPLTVHIPLSAVPGAITTALMLSSVRTVWHALQRDFGVRAPRIAIAGLNPHAGESGTIGREDQDVIAPAIAALRAEGINLTGPHPADTLFHASARQTYDVVIAMYHDQALIPIKTLAFDRGVNITLGLPFVRTSPDHGTAFDIAAQGVANPASLIEALLMAARMAAHRCAVDLKERAS